MARSSVTRASSYFSLLISDGWLSFATPLGEDPFRFIQAHNECVLTPKRCETSAIPCSRSVICLIASILKSSVNRGWSIIFSLPHFVMGKMSTNLRAVQFKIAHQIQNWSAEAGNNKQQIALLHGLKNEIRAGRIFHWTSIVKEALLWPLRRRAIGGSQARD